MPPHVIATSPLAPCGRTQKVTRPGQPILRQVVARPRFRGDDKLSPG